MPSIWPRSSTHNSGQTSSLWSYSSKVNKSILDQLEWIQLFSQQPGNNPLGALDIKKQWLTNPRAAVFFNPTNHQSMRLTRVGYTYLKQYLKLTYYEFKLVNQIKPKVLLQLERLVHYPYFVHNLTKIMVFDEQTAIMLQLHGSDLETYLDNLEQHQ